MPPFLLSEDRSGGIQTFESIEGNTHTVELNGDGWEQAFFEDAGNYYLRQLNLLIGPQATGLDLFVRKAQYLSLSGLTVDMEAATVALNVTGTASRPVVTTDDIWVGGCREGVGFRAQSVTLHAVNLKMADLAVGISLLDVHGWLSAPVVHGHFSECGINVTGCNYLAITEPHIQVPDGVALTITGHSYVAVYGGRIRGAVEVEPGSTLKLIGVDA